MKPFLKWAGGKRWLINTYKHLFPKKFNIYFEPFLGSGAVFFYLQPQHAFLSDTNIDLIKCYHSLKDDYINVELLLKKHHQYHSKEYYYKIREYSPDNDIERAARLIYLNRTCFNGLYRVNKKGNFNVPIGTKNKVVMDDDNFFMISHLLSGAHIESADFESIIDRASINDFIFADPPYTVAHGNNGFIKYNEQLFSWDDQKRLSDALIRANQRGVKILSTNADHYSVIDLYKKDFNIIKINRASVISGKAEKRKVCSEIVISNITSNL